MPQVANRTMWSTVVIVATLTYVTYKQSYMYTSAVLPWQSSNVFLKKDISIKHMKGFLPVAKMVDQKLNMSKMISIITSMEGFASFFNHLCLVIFHDYFIDTLIDTGKLQSTLKTLNSYEKPRFLSYDSLRMKQLCLRSFSTHCTLHRSCLIIFM